HSTTGESKAQARRPSTSKREATGQAPSQQAPTTRSTAGKASPQAPTAAQRNTTGQAPAEAQQPPKTNRSTTGQAPTKPSPQKPASNTAAPSAQSNAPPQTQTASTPSTVRTASGRTVSAQQLTNVQQSVLSASSVPRVSRVDFALDPGVVVPSRVRYTRFTAYPALIEAFPYYRDDYFFVAEDEIVVLSPRRRIVDVIPVGPRSHFARSSSSESEVMLSPEEIREVQQVLVRDGFDVRVDGVWGPSTRDALISFQRRQGFQTTGIIDMRTVDALGLKDRINEAHVQGGAAAGQTVGQQPSGQPNAAQQNSRMNAQQPSTSGRGNQQPSTTGQGSQQPSASGQANQRSTSTPSTTGQGSQHPSSNQATDQQPNANKAPTTSGQGTHQPSAPKPETDRHNRPHSQ